nr:hypothetical protein [Hyphomonadaceae bacterium]
MTVVFSTYQSLAAVADAQANHGLPDFDLIICDEARRILRGYTVFNAEQIDGLPERFAAQPEPVTPVVPLTPEGANDARLSALFARRALRGKFFDGCATCAGGANAQRCLPPSAMAETG